MAVFIPTPPPPTKLGRVIGMALYIRLARLPSVYLHFVSGADLGSPRMDFLEGVDVPFMVFMHQPKFWRMPIVVIRRVCPSVCLPRFSTITCLR